MTISFLSIRGSFVTHVFLLSLFWYLTFRLLEYAYVCTPVLNLADTDES